jgi:hypothetical protein
MHMVMVFLSTLPTVRRLYFAKPLLTLHREPRFYQEATRPPHTGARQHFSANTGLKGRQRHIHYRHQETAAGDCIIPPNAAKRRV